MLISELKYKAAEKENNWSSEFYRYLKAYSSLFDKENTSAQLSLSSTANALIAPAAFNPLIPNFTQSMGNISCSC
jgi:hypothetical protein